MEWQFNSGRTFAILPVKCVDGQWAWLRFVWFAEVNSGMFFNPYTVRRHYSVTEGVWDAARSRWLSAALLPKASVREERG